MKQAISTTDAPAAVGPYSQAVDTGNMLFASGQLPVDPSTGSIVNGGTGAQAEQCCKNVAALLKAVGLKFENVVKSTVFITDMADFSAVNEIYKQYFIAPYPARSCVAVKALPLGCSVEIEIIATR